MMRRIYNIRTKAFVDKPQVTMLPKCLLCFSRVQLKNHCYMVIYREYESNGSLAEEHSAFLCGFCAGVFRDKYGIRPSKLSIPLESKIKAKQCPS